MVACAVKWLCERSRCGAGDGESCGRGVGDERFAAAAASLSRAATLSAGLKVILEALNTLDLFNKSAGSTLLSRMSFLTLLRAPVPRVGLGLPPVKNDSGPNELFPLAALVKESALGLFEPNSPFVLAPLGPGAWAVDEYPRNFDIAGVYPRPSLGSGERVGISEK